ncbi:MAG: FISUMP domain-containing protein [Bacteroidales bacterium]
MIKEVFKGILLTQLVLVLFSCNKKETLVPTVTTDSISAITDNSAVCGGTLISEGGGIIIARGICWSEDILPTSNNNKIDGDSETDTFICKISNLEPLTTYYVRAYATNISGTGYGVPLSFTTREKTSEVTDIDGNLYHSVVIGTQEWLTENLKSTHYADGIEIPLITDYNEWGNLADNDTDKAYCFYNNNVTGEADIYGILYTWSAATNGIGNDSINNINIQGVCPDGWHIPSNEEWQQLIDYISSDGFAENVGFALKATSGWIEDGNGIDAYGFDAQPSGSRSATESGSFSNPGYCSWWSSTENDLVCAYRSRLTYSNSSIEKRSSDKSNGFSVRCIKD